MISQQNLFLVFQVFGKMNSGVHPKDGGGTGALVAFISNKKKIERDEWFHVIMIINHPYTAAGLLRNLM